MASEALTRQICRSGEARALEQAGIGVIGPRRCGRAVTGRSGCFRHEAEKRRRCGAVGCHGVIAPMSVAPARLTFFLEVVDFATCCHFAIAADDATAGKSGEAEKPDETHNILRSFAEQVVCR